MKMTFKELPEFSGEFKRFFKKYKSLVSDLEEFKHIINVGPLGNGKHFSVLTKNERCTIVKARLFCRYFKGSSLRIIYAFHQRVSEVVFIELYFKGEKENEDGSRINNYLKNC